MLVRSLFISLKAFSCLEPQSRESFPDPAVASYNGLAISEKPGIQIQQNLAAARNSQPPFLVFGWAIEQMANFLSCLSAQCPSEMMNPNNLISCLQI